MVKNNWLIIVFSVLGLYANGQDQIYAITTSGRQVVLDTKDSTWSYAENQKSKSLTVAYNDTIYTKPEESKNQLKSKVCKGVSLNYNKSLWTSLKNPTLSNQDAEFALNYKKSSSLMAIVINEDIQYDIEILADIVINNAKQALTDTEVHTYEYRKVNEVDITFIKLDGFLPELKKRLTYYYYIHSFKGGSTQNMVMTFSDRDHKFQDEIFNLLNGLMVDE